jgi:large subunit ribosomal protein L21
MYAVIETGGKQYRVEVGSQIEVEYLDAEPGQTLDLERVLLVADGDATAIGRPLVEGARVSAEVVRQDRGDKIVVFKYRPKARSRVKHGHRQEQTVLRVADIVHGDRSAASLAEAARTERARLEAAAAEGAARQAAADRALADKLAAGQAQAEAAAASAAKGEAKAPGATAKGEAKAPGATAKAPASKAGGAVAGSKAGRAAAARAKAPRAPRTQAPAPEGEPKPKSRGTRKDA